MTPDDVAKRIWPSHKTYHCLKLQSKSEENRRLMYFKENHIFIELFNQQSKSHKCKHNSLSHWNYEEYETWLRHKPRDSDAVKQKKLQEQPVLMDTKDYVNTLPTSIDWKKGSKVTPVKHQGSCGSCYAFSCVGAIESAYAIQNNNLVCLSEQQIVDCSNRSFGCFGGSIEGTYEYIKESGVMKSDAYPYTGEEGECKYSPENTSKISGYKIIEPDEQSLMVVLAHIGPASIAINAASKSFQFYNSGVFYDPEVSSDKLNHAVLCVGYGHQNDNNYWYIKNSWGNEWGDNGYVYVRRDDKHYLGVTKHAYYPIL